MTLYTYIFFLQFFDTVTWQCLQFTDIVNGLLTFLHGLLTSCTDTVKLQCLWFTDPVYSLLTLITINVDSVY